MSSTKQNSAVYVSNPNYANEHSRVDSGHSLRDEYEDSVSLDINTYAKIMREHTLKQMDKARRMSRSRRSGDTPTLNSESSVESEISR